MIRKEQIVTITELRQDPHAAIKKSKKEFPIYLFSRSKPLGVIMDIDEFERLMERWEDFIDAMELKETVETTKEEGMVPFEKFWKKHKFTTS